MRFFRNWLALLALLAAWPAHAVTVLAGHPVLFALAQDLAGEKSPWCVPRPRIFRPPG